MGSCPISRRLLVFLREQIVVNGGIVIGSELQLSAEGVQEPILVLTENRSKGDTNLLEYFVCPLGEIQALLYDIFRVAEIRAVGLASALGYKLLQLVVDVVTEQSHIDESQDQLEEVHTSEGVPAVCPCFRSHHPTGCRVETRSWTYVPCVKCGTWAVH